MLAAELLRNETSPLRYQDLAIPGWPDIDPVTVVMALEDAAAANGIALKQSVVDKAHAVQTALLNPVAYADPYVFEKTAEALNGLEPQFDYFPVMLMPAQLALAAVTLNKLRPKEEWGVSVKRYVREVLREQGVVELPPCLAFLKFDDPTAPSTLELSGEQRKVLDERIADIEDYVRGTV